MKNRLLTTSNEPAICEWCLDSCGALKNNTVLGEPRVQVGADDLRTIPRLFKWQSSTVAACEEVMRANHPRLVPRGGLRAPIVWGDGMVCGAAIWVGMGKPTAVSAKRCILGHQLVGRTKKVSMLNSRGGSSTNAMSMMACL